MADKREIILSTSGLTKIFGFGRSKTLAVDHVDINIYESEVVSIVGESGSGKTTFAKMILGLLKPTEGEIYFQGEKRDIRSHKAKQEYWKNIQAIFQEAFRLLKPGGAVISQIAKKKHSWLDRAFLEKLGVECIRERLLGKLSCIITVVKKDDAGAVQGDHGVSG